MNKYKVNLTWSPDIPEGYSTEEIVTANNADEAQAIAVSLADSVYYGEHGIAHGKWVINSVETLGASSEPANESDSYTPYFSESSQFYDYDGDGYVSYSVFLAPDADQSPLYVGTSSQEYNPYFSQLSGTEIG